MNIPVATLNLVKSQAESIKSVVPLLCIRLGRLVDDDGDDLQPRKDPGGNLRPVTVTD